MQDTQYDIVAQLPSDLELDELKQIAIQEGVAITQASFQNGLNGMMLRARNYYESKQRNKRKRPDWYEKSRNLALAARDAIALFSNFVLVVFGIPAAIVALFVSEIIAVRLGLESFLHDEVAVFSLSFTTVTTYFALLWYRASMLKIEKEDPPFRFSLRLAAHRIIYILGGSLKRGSEWVPEVKREKTSAHRSTIALRWLMILIVLLGVLGRLSEQDAMKNASWLQGLVEIIENSTLSELMTYIGGGMISLALLVATHYLIQFIHDAYGKAVGATEVDFFSEDESAGLYLAEDEAAKEYYRSRIIQNRQAKLTQMNHQTPQVEKTE